MFVRKSRVNKVLDELLDLDAVLTRREKLMSRYVKHNDSPIPRHELVHLRGKTIAVRHATRKLKELLK